ncbi:MAG: sulfatase-like hydrolase/transferase [Desulfobacterales bacterium]|nr:sulfatase-like hydrolase/transferase [Desulfobacterales bacterium]
MDVNKKTSKYYYIAPTAFIVSVFFIIPYELYYNAQVYWSWNKYIPFVINSFGIGVYVAIIVALKLLFRFNLGQAAKFFSFLLFFMGVFILFADVFAPLQTNPATGEKLVSGEPLVYTIIELGLFFTLAALFVKADFDSGARIVSCFCLVLLFISAGYFLLVASSSKPGIAPKEEKQHDAAENRQSHSAKIKGNIYHILLDQMQTDAARLYLTDGSNKEKFKGFTLFANNIANYKFTTASFPSYISSSFYKKGSYEDWMRGVYKTGGLFKALHDKGYQIRQYAYFFDWNAPFTTEFRTLKDVYQEVTKLKHRELVDFIQIWFARIMPNFLANEALALGKKIGFQVYGILETDHIFGKIQKIPVAYDEGIEPYSSVHAFRHMIESEKRRPANGQYLYFHSVLPHPPYVYGRECDYSLDYRDKEVEGFCGQVACAFKLVEELIDELKRLGRYEDSTILIHADTGRGQEGFFFKKDEKTYGTMDKEHFDENMPRMKSLVKNESDALPSRIGNFHQDRILSWFHALFMIKPPHSPGPLRVSERLTQLVDVYPTLADILNLETIENEEVEGISAFSDPFPGDREGTIFWFPHGVMEPSISKFTISNYANLKESTIKYVGRVVGVETAKFPADGVIVKVGSKDEGRVRFKNFSFKSAFKNKATYRWGMGKKGKIVFAGLRLDQEAELIFSFRLKPFVVNENREMVLSTPLSRVKTRLKPGLNSYIVTLKFPANVDPTIRVEYAHAQSPQNLGTGPDPRLLSAFWTHVSLTPPSSRFAGSLVRDEIVEFPAGGVAVKIGSADEGRVRFENFGAKGKGKNNFTYRWGVGKKATIAFPGLRLDKEAELNFSFKLKPFVVNENREMNLSTPLSMKKIRLKPGLNSYSAALKFPRYSDPTVHIEYADAQSPKNLGTGPDARRLSALWTHLSLTRSRAE